MPDVGRKISALGGLFSCEYSQLFRGAHPEFRWQHDPILTENTDVKWRLDKNNFIVLDERGKEFKMKLVKKRKDDEPAPPLPPTTSK